MSALLAWAFGLSGRIGQFLGPQNVDNVKKSTFFVSDGIARFFLPTQIGQTLKRTSA